MDRLINKFCNVLLLLTAMIWGFAFVAQSVAMNNIGPWSFVFSRFLLATITLIPISIYSNLLSLKKGNSKIFNINSKVHYIKKTIKGGMICGIFLGLASVTQQIGLLSTSVGKAGFITSLYVVIVPILNYIIYKRYDKKNIVIVMLALLGLYMISFKTGTELLIEKGDGLILLCSILFSLQIISIDYFTKDINPVLLSNVQFLFASIVGFIGMMIFETIKLKNVIEAAVPILYAGIMSSAIGYTFQVIGQKYTDPSIATIILSMESVFSALAGWIILKQHLTGKELLGCLLVFIAVVLTELL